jgi:hypothetical protein
MKDFSFSKKFFLLKIYNFLTYNAPILGETHVQSTDYVVKNISLSLRLFFLFTKAKIINASQDIDGQQAQ